MKKVTNFEIIIVILSIVAIIGLSFVGCKQAIPVTTTAATTAVTTAATTAAITSATTAAETSAKETETTVKDTTSDQIKVTKPTPNQLIQSPLIVEGEARGTWFFEATFPVKLLDANGNIIASNPAQAQGDWMTEGFVPFKVQLDFVRPATDTGVLILQKDNPSGLSENDAKIEIPVRFNSSLSKIVEEADPQKGEYFVNATLKNIDLNNNKITVIQLINEPNEKVISPEVTLSKDCKIIKVILERPGEKETVTEITLDSIKLGSEIGIIFKSDNTARAIIYQEIIEK
ncbi:MAG: Gmad2 immunoglobulin-like domain-containing protein [Actinobacteria bacterium]|nr:Gmad2 immunoglobulin-like domain-containing protein [Actinomycetota bacterium]